MRKLMKKTFCSSAADVYCYNALLDERFGCNHPKSEGAEIYNVTVGRKQKSHYDQNRDNSAESKTGLCEICRPEGRQIQIHILQYGSL